MAGRVTVLVYDAHDAERYAALIRAPRGRVTVRTAATPDEAHAHIAEADVLYAWGFPADLYPKAGRLRWLSVMGAGVDGALVPALPPAVTVTRMPGVFGPWMAEYVLGWCLWVTQRMAAYRAAQAEQRWLHLTPSRLAGTTMTVVGTGDIGRTIARAARGLGLRVTGVRRSAARTPGFERIYPVSALPRALAAADWVVLTLPLTAATRGLIGARALAAMRPSAWLLNVGRGAVVDERALLQALGERKIAGAVLDVFEAEPLPPGHPLWRLDNVVVTPHVSGPSTPEELSPIFNDNLARFLAGRPLRHVVDRAKGY
jgi:phosphoglycerate dehydrogenase-like enzyme